MSPRHWIIATRRPKRASKCCVCPSARVRASSGWATGTRRRRSTPSQCRGRWWRSLPRGHGRRGCISFSGWSSGRGIPRRSTIPPFSSGRRRAISAATARSTPKRSSPRALRLRFSTPATARSGSFICADQRSPELSRLLALKGARILFQPTNYFHADGVDIRRRYMGKCTAQRARAMDNGVHLVIANAGRPEYVNNSRIVEPNGQGPEHKLAYATRAVAV